ncbi:hypothetical protein FOXYSP1_20145 [Fusarium oxysporum f. sp. phaseoli]
MPLCNGLTNNSARPPAPPLIPPTPEPRTRIPLRTEQSSEDTK